MELLCRSTTLMLRTSTATNGHNKGQGGIDVPVAVVGVGTAMLEAGDVAINNIVIIVVHHVAREVQVPVDT